MSSKEIEIANQRFQVITADNDFIRKSRYSLTLLEEKLLLYIISKVKPNDKAFKMYRFSVKEIAQVMGLNNSYGNYKDIKDALIKLAQAEWVMMDNVLMTISWLNKVKIYTNENIVEVRLDDDLLPYLTSLFGNFTKLQLASILCFKSKHSIRLYEYLKTFTYRNTVKIKLETLKEITNTTGKYNRWIDFKRNVIDKAFNEINVYSDILIKYIVIKKQGTKTIIGLDISISEKEDYEWKDTANNKINKQEDIIFDY